MSDESLFLGLVNNLLNWREYSHEILSDYLDEAGFGRKFHEHGGLHTRVGVVRALINIGALDRDRVCELELPVSEQQRAIALADDCD